MWRKRVSVRQSGAPGAVSGTGQKVQCPLCGNRFDPAESQACAHCPRLFRSCRMVVCPRCSHEFYKG